MSVVGCALAFAPALHAPRGHFHLSTRSWQIAQTLPTARRVRPPRASQRLAASAAAADTSKLDAPTTKAGTGPLSKVSDLFGKVWRLGAPFWYGPNKRKALVWTLVTVLLALVTTIYTVSISFVQKFFWNALNAKDLPKFNKFLLLYLAILTIGPPLLVLFDWCKARMAVAWRNDLTSTQFTCFTSATVQILTPVELQELTSLTTLMRCATTSCP